MAGHQRTSVIAMDGLNVVTGALPLTLEQIAVEFETFTHIPIQRSTVLHRLIDTLRRQTKYRPRMQHVVGHHTSTEGVFMITVPVIQQAALLAKEQVVAPGFVGAAPVGGFVDKRLVGRGHLAVLDQTDLHLINTTWQHSGIKRLQARLDRLTVNQYSIAVDLRHGRPVGGDINGRGTWRTVVDRQAVAAAEHHAQGCVRAAAKQAWLASKSLSSRGEVAQAKEMTVNQPFAIQLLKVIAR
ncbi:hypothetical protein D3C78_672820 [compost metagenome]